MPSSRRRRQLESLVARRREIAARAGCFRRARDHEYQINLEDLPAVGDAFRDVLGHATLRADEVRAIAIPAAMAQRGYRSESVYGILRSAGGRWPSLLPGASQRGLLGHQTPRTP